MIPPAFRIASRNPRPAPHLQPLPRTIRLRYSNGGASQPYLAYLSWIRKNRDIPGRRNRTQGADPDLDNVIYHLKCRHR